LAVLWPKSSLTFIHMQFYIGIKFLIATGAGEVIAVKVLIALKVAAFLAGLVLPVASFVAFGVRLLVSGVLSASMHR